MSTEIKQESKATKFIFPLSESTHKSKYVEAMIIAYLDPNSKVMLSMVNLKAREILNNKYFEKLFLNEVSQNYLYLRERLLNPPNPLEARLAQYIMNTYPDNCWKVCCWVFSNPTRAFPTPKLNTENTEKDYNTIHKNLIRGWNLEKEFLELKLKEICGNGYEDPNSEIHKAWKLKETGLINILELKKEYDDFVSSVSENNSLEEGEQYFEVALKTFYESLDEITILKLNLSKNDQVLLEGFLSGEEEVGISENNKSILETSIFELLNNCDMLTKSEIANIKKYTKFTISSRIIQRNIEKYDFLESNRIKHENDIKQVDRKISLNINFTEIKLFKKIQKLTLINIKDLSILNESINLTQINHIVIPNESIDKLKNYINSTSFSGSIWQKLYDECALEINEDCWSEKHFQEYPNEFYSIISDHNHKIAENLNILEWNKIPVDYNTKRIRNLINSCSKGKEIWEILYVRCANRKIEDNWSENNFQKHHYELKNILVEILFDFERYPISMLERGFTETTKQEIIKIWELLN